MAAHDRRTSNVAYPLTPARRLAARTTSRRRSPAALRLVGLDAAGRPPRRPALGRPAAAGRAGPRPGRCEPDVLLLDEPLSNLDAKLRDEMRSEIREDPAGDSASPRLRHPRPGRGTGHLRRHRGDGPGRIAELGPPQHVYQVPQTGFGAEFLGAATNLPARSLAASGQRCSGSSPHRDTPLPLPHAPARIRRESRCTFAPRRSSSPRPGPGRRLGGRRPDRTGGLHGRSARVDRRGRGDSLARALAGGDGR